jgi:hypothetical protein
VVIVPSWWVLAFPLSPELFLPLTLLIFFGSLQMQIVFLVFEQMVVLMVVCMPVENKKESKSCIPNHVIFPMVFPKKILFHSTHHP